jgi:signal transduction histidine kinase
MKPELQDRVLLLAQRGRDAEVLTAVLGGENHLCVTCLDADELARALAEGADVALLTEESLPADPAALLAWLDAQPAWSDFPFVLLATKRTGRRPRLAQVLLERLGNVVVLERPIHAETLVSAVDSALRGRRRQYEARRHLKALTAAEERLTDLNADLERRIAMRTAELSEANNRLLHEVAEREQAQAALAQSQKMEAVGQLTGGIAHDFNNLLTVIIGNLDLIRRRTGETRIATLAGHAHEAGDRAAKLTHQLMAFSRSQRLNLQPVDLNALISGMGNLLGRSIGPRVAIVTTLDKASPWALADINQLELAVLNLVINARDAMPAGGTVTIATGRASPGPGMALAAGDYGVITVSDTGSGIPEHLLARIFDPFFTTKPVGKGTGLGLSQVYGIAQQSGGTATVRSRPGEGAEVSIWLPMSEAALPAAAARLAPASLSARDSEKVLVIDDDHGVRQVMVDALRSAGYGVRDAEAGPAGLAELADWPADLVIVDYAMPEMNGVEVVEAARRQRPDLPIILATGYADMAAVDAVIDRRFVLHKPFRIDDLLQAARAAIEDAPA